MQAVQLVELVEQVVHGNLHFSIQFFSDERINYPLQTEHTPLAQVLHPFGHG